MQVVGVSVVVDDPPIFELIGCDDRVITLMEQFSPMHGFASLLVAFPLCGHDGSWNTQSHFAINTSALKAGFCPALLGIALHRGDFVSQKMSGFAPGVSDECLFFGETQAQFLTQKRSHLPFDVLCLLLWPRKSEAEVVGIADIFEPPVVRVVWVDGRKLLELFSQFEGSLLLPVSQQFVHLFVEFDILLVELSLLPSRILWDEHGFDKRIQFVEQNIAEDGADNRALCKASNYAKRYAKNMDFRPFRGRFVSATRSVETDRGG